uniref:N-acetyltransferase n=1 Tax=Thermosporothrix sp. COM3 TaxID=2490863 RepID=A0A455SHA9_9CHLR|nr:N-acetyltransferase [Thermosporothrix sp. COM3]
MNITPITLSGTYARLEPLHLDHVEALFDAAQDEAIWTFLPEKAGQSLESMQAWVKQALREQEEGTSLPFVIVSLQHDCIVGSTRYLDIDRVNRGLEIGWTWLNPLAQRTSINTECKYTLLRHAFETLGCIRVQLKTDVRNLQSQRAIERIGGIKEGILRQHRILSDGYRRDSVLYSILDTEWPHVKVKLEAKLSK